MDGYAHTITARYAGTGGELWGSPKTLTCSATPAPLDTRRIGVRPTGSYWGAGGEQIDVASGNLNYAVPLIRALSRSGWGMSNPRIDEVTPEAVADFLIASAEDKKVHRRFNARVGGAVPALPDGLGAASEPPAALRSRLRAYVA